MTEEKKKPAAKKEGAVSPKVGVAPKAAAPKKEAAPKAAAAKEAKPAAAKAAPAAAPKPAKSGKTLTIIQTGSPIGRQRYQEATLIGLGLNKRHRTRTLEDSPAVRGMIEKVKHLVKVV